MKILALLIVTCTLSVQGQSTISVKQLLSASTMPHYTRSDIKRMIRVAQTPDEFERLADYFDQKAMEYETKSQLEEQELNRLVALPFHSRSFATQVESTRNRMDHLKALSRTCSKQAAEYRYRAQTGESASPNTASSTCRGLTVDRSIAEGRFAQRR